MNIDRNFNVYKLLFNDINTLKERIGKLEKENTEYRSIINTFLEFGSIPSVIITDINFVEHSLEVSLYDRKANKSITRSLNLTGKE